MISGTRGRNIVIVASFLALALGGCSFIGDAGQLWGLLQADTAQKRALAEAATALKGIDGVESASSNFVAAGPVGDEAELHVVASASIAEEHLREIAAIARESFASAELEETAPTLILRFGDNDGGGALTQRYRELSDDQLLNEIAYWRAVEAAIETELSLTLNPTLTEGTYDRAFSVPPRADATRTSEYFIEHFAALSAVPDGTQVPTNWQLAGLWGVPNLPSAEFVAALGDIQRLIPLVDNVTVPETATLDYEFPEGVMLWWNDFGPEVGSRTEIIIQQDEYRATDWHTTVAAAKRAAQAPGLAVRYLAGEQQFQLHTSTCVGTIHESSDDQEFYAAVLASGTEFLPGAGPGTCIPER